MSFKDTNDNKSLIKNILIYVFLGFSSYMVADLVLLKFVRIKFFPSYTAKDAAQAKAFAQKNSFGYRSAGGSNKDLKDYSKGYKHIINRNLFNADGIISPPIASLEAGSGEGDPEDEVFNDPVLSSLDLKLEGTIVHRNPYRSLATIQTGGKNSSYTVGDQIEDLAEVISVVRKKVIIRNLSSKRLEYIEIPRNIKLAKKRPAPPKLRPSFNKPANTGPSIVEREGNSFRAKRSDVDAQLSNMGKLLREAKVERAVDPVTGEVMGFKLTQLKPDSVLTQLGLEVGDVISAVDGEPVTSPNKAMLLYNQMKNASNLKLTIKRNGSDQDLEYSIED